MKLGNSVFMLHMLNIFKENIWNNSVKFWKSSLNWTQLTLTTQTSFSAVNKWMYKHYKSEAQLRLLCNSRRFASEGEGGRTHFIRSILFQSLFRGYKETKNIYFISSYKQPAWNESNN
jgi:hypothetical protein